MSGDELLSMMLGLVAFTANGLFLCYLAYQGLVRAPQSPEEEGSAAGRFIRQIIFIGVGLAKTSLPLAAAFLAIAHLHLPPLAFVGGVFAGLLVVALVVALTERRLLRRAR